MGTGVETCKNTAKIQNATGMGTGYGNKVWEQGMGTGRLKEKLKMSRGHMAGHADDGRFDQPPRTQGALGAFGPLKKSLRSRIHARNPPKWSATPFISCPEPPKMGGFAAHFWIFRA